MTKATGLLGFLSALWALWRHFRAFAKRHAMVKTWEQQGVQISDQALIVQGERACLEIGEGSTIGPYTVLDLSDDPVAAQAGTAVPAKLTIGKRTAINEFNNLREAGGTITIGDNCLLSQFVSVIASNHCIDTPGLIRDMPWSTTGNSVQIGNGAWVGAHAVILPGVRLGDGCVVAAGSVVTADVPERAVAAGVPAVVKRFRVPDPASGTRDRQ